MEYSYKFRLYPSATQAQQIQRTFGCCRFVWNYYLAMRKEIYEQDRKTMNYYDCSKDMTQLKKTLASDIGHVQFVVLLMTEISMPHRILSQKGFDKSDYLLNKITIIGWGTPKCTLVDIV